MVEKEAVTESEEKEVAVAREETEVVTEEMAAETLRTPSRTQFDERSTESDEAECALSENLIVHHRRFHQSVTTSESFLLEELRRSERT